MTDNEIIKALECCVNGEDCPNCPLQEQFADCKPMTGALDLINRQKAENNDLFCKLTGVMHSVDKWLSVDELKQDEVNRAITMREKTLQIVEKQKAEIESLRNDLAKEFVCFVGSPHKVESCPFFDELENERAEAVKEFAERLKAEKFEHQNFGGLIYYEDVDNLVKEMVGDIR